MSLSFATYLVRTVIILYIENISKTFNTDPGR